jgi:hypothetical protein
MKSATAGVLLGFGLILIGDPALSAQESPNLRPPHPYSADGVFDANDWIQTDGRRIFYRYSRYLPDACQPSAERATYATGNFNGWGAFPVTCLPGGEWLAFDVLSTLREGTQYNTTYCFNFRDGAGAWGAHGRPPIAPGLENFVVPTPRRQVGSGVRNWGQDGVNPGFRIVRANAGPQVQLASYRHRSERIEIPWLGTAGVVLESQSPGDPPC